MNIKCKSTQKATFEDLLPGTVFLYGTFLWLKTTDLDKNSVCLSDGRVLRINVTTLVELFNGSFVEE
jgi:hypothetical protein